MNKQWNINHLPLRMPCCLVMNCINNMRIKKTTMLIWFYLHTKLTSRTLQLLLIYIHSIVYRGQRPRPGVHDGKIDCSQMAPRKYTHDTTLYTYIKVQTYLENKNKLYSTISTYILYCPRLSNK